MRDSQINLTNPKLEEQSGLCARPDALHVYSALLHLQAEYVLCWHTAPVSTQIIRALFMDWNSQRDSKLSNSFLLTQQIALSQNL